MNALQLVSRVPFTVNGTKIEKMGQDGNYWHVIQTAHLHIVAGDCPVFAAKHIPTRHVLCETRASASYTVGIGHSQTDARQDRGGAAAYYPLRRL